MITTQSLGLDGYWLSPNGEIYPVTFCRHAMVAQDICSALGINDTTPEQSEQTLTRKGWLHIGLNYIGIIRYNDISNAQIDSLFQIYRSATKALYDAITEYMFK